MVLCLSSGDIESIGNHATNCVTMFSAEAFCSAEPARQHCRSWFVLICPLSAAMLVAVR